MSLEKTEEPTEQRLRELRKKGDVPISRELLQGAAMLAALIAMSSGFAPFAAGLASLTREAWQAGAEPVVQLEAAAWLVIGFALPPLVAATLAAALAGLAQTGGLVAMQRVLPDGERLKPGRVWQGRFRKEQLVGAAIATAFALAGATIVAVLLTTWVNQAEALALESAGRWTLLVSRSLDRAWLAVSALIGLVVVYSLVDALWQRRAFIDRNRMSKQEIRDEYKRSEGDPEHKARRDRAWREMMTVTVREGVARTDVVIRNPNHIAVGLRYRPEEGDFPTVTITGRGEQARTIVREARRKGVPEFHDRQVARATVDLEPGDAVPESLFEPVAIVFRWLGDQGWTPDGWRR